MTYDKYFFKKTKKIVEIGDFSELMSIKVGWERVFEGAPPHLCEKNELFHSSYLEKFKLSFFCFLSEFKLYF